MALQHELRFLMKHAPSYTVKSEQNPDYSVSSPSSSGIPVLLLNQLIIECLFYLFRALGGWPTSWTGVPSSRSILHAAISPGDSVLLLVVDWSEDNANFLLGGGVWGSYCCVTFAE